MNRLTSLIPQGETSPAPPSLTDPMDVSEFNDVIALFNPQWRPLDLWQMNGLAFLFVSRQAPDWALACIHMRCRQAEALKRLAKSDWPLPPPLADPVHELGGWVSNRAPQFRFPNPSDSCVPTALAMECVEERVSSQIKDFLDYCSLRSLLAHRAGVDVDLFEFSVEEWCALRCYQARARRGFGSYLPGAFLPRSPARFLVS